jgi:hypothetical protein
LCQRHKYHPNYNQIFYLNKAYTGTTKITICYIRVHVSLKWISNAVASVTVKAQKCVCLTDAKKALGSGGQIRLLGKSITINLLKIFLIAYLYLTYNAFIEAFHESWASIPWCTGYWRELSTRRIGLY